MDPMTDPILSQFCAEAQTYCDARGISLGTLAAYAVDDNTLFVRLSQGGQCLPRTMQKVRDYMLRNPPTGRRVGRPKPPTPNAGSIALTEWMQSQGLKHGAAAQRFGISRSYTAEIVNGKLPGRETIRKIDEATGGKVPPAAWFTSAGGARG